MAYHGSALRSAMRQPPCAGGAVATAAGVPQKAIVKMSWVKRKLAVSRPLNSDALLKSSECDGGNTQWHAASVQLARQPAPGIMTVSIPRTPLYGATLRSDRTGHRPDRNRHSATPLRGASIDRAVVFGQPQGTPTAAAPALEVAIPHHGLLARPGDGGQVGQLHRSQCRQCQSQVDQAVGSIAIGWVERSSQVACASGVNRRTTGPAGRCPARQRGHGRWPAGACARRR